VFDPIQLKNLIAATLREQLAPLIARIEALEKLVAELAETKKQSKVK
jgi:BMFP domain-containing protein YqiC